MQADGGVFPVPILLSDDYDRSCGNYFRGDISKGADNCKEINNHSGFRVIIFDKKVRDEQMPIVGDVRNPSQSGILNGTCKGECWISDDKMLGVTYSYPVGGCGVFGKIESKENAKIYFDKVFGYLKAMNIHEFELRIKKS